MTRSNLVELADIIVEQAQEQLESAKELRAALYNLHNAIGLASTPSKAVGGRAPKGAKLKPPEVSEAVLEYIKANPGKTGEELTSALGMETGALHYPLKRLRDQGLVEIKGQRRWSKYYAVASKASGRAARS